MTEDECGTLMVRLILYEVWMLLAMGCMWMLIILFRR